MPVADFNKVGDLPFPMRQATADSEGDFHYEPFDKVYGTVTDERDMPSLVPDESVDAKHRGMFGQNYARHVIRCTECGKYRVIFSPR